MIRLLCRGDGRVGPRAGGDGFVPHLESLEGRAIPGIASIKFPFEVANAEEAAQVSILPPPTVGLAAPLPLGGAAGAAGLVGVSGGDAGFDRGGVWHDLAKTDKDKFDVSYLGGDTSGSGHAHGVWVGAGSEGPAPASKATPIIF